MKKLEIGARKKRLGLLASGLITTITFTANAYAAEPENAAIANNVQQDIEEITVTGSRIRRTNASSSVPLQVLTSEEILEIGSTDLQIVLEDLPGVEFGISDEGSTDSIQSNGLSTISLRRLGDDRSLVLVNGKRGITNSGNSNRFDLSTIPTGFVKSVDVTTGGASAVYGSDAIAGVVNITLEDSFEGNRITARYSSPEASGRDQRELSFLSGRTFNNDKGYFLFGANILDRNPLFADSSRPETLLPIEFDDPSFGSRDLFADEPNQPGCQPLPVGNDVHCILGSYSQSTPGGVFEGGDAWFRDGQWFNDQSLQPGDRSGSADFFADADGYNFREDRALLGGAERENIGINTTYDFTDNLSGSLAAMYSSNSSNTPRGYETLNDSDTFGPDGQFRVGNIASDHPFIPAEVEETRRGSVDFDRRVVELGQQTRLSDRETIRIFADLTGDVTLANKDFAWEVYGTYGRFTQETGVINELNLRNARHALQIEDDGNGGFQCQNAAARAAGCVPLNIFGEGTITQAAADYIRYNSFGVNELTQHSVGGFISGDLFDVSAGSVKGVFGVEHRRDLQDTVGDPDSRINGLDNDPANDNDIDATDVNVSSVAVFPDLKAEQSVIEVFGELEIPLIEDKLYLNLAARNADYDSVGAVQSYNFGGVWNATDYLKIRSQFSTAQRAPNLTELYSSPRPDFDDLNDPCDGLLEDGSGLDAGRIAGSVVPGASLTTIATNCLAQAGIQQFFADNQPDPAIPGDPPPEFSPGSSVQGPNAGNAHVQEESAETFTIGTVFSPAFAEGLIMTLDYYKIDIEDAIGSISTQDVVDLCYADPNFDPTSRFCAPITRSVIDGEVREVINRQENLNNEIVEGIDFSFRYEMPLENLFRAASGDIDFDFRYTHYLTDETIFTGTDGTEVVSTFLGELNSPKDSYRFKIGYDINDLRLVWTTDYEPGGIDDKAGAPTPASDRYFAVDGEFFHRLYVRYDFGEGDKYRISAGIDNVFDNAGPLVPAGTASGDSYNIGTNVNDLVGRDYFLQFRATFD